MLYFDSSSAFIDIAWLLLRPGTSWIAAGLMGSLHFASLQQAARQAFSERTMSGMCAPVIHSVSLIKETAAASLYEFLKKNFVRVHAR